MNQSSVVIDYPINQLYIHAWLMAWLSLTISLWTMMKSGLACDRFKFNGYKKPPKKIQKHPMSSGYHAQAQFLSRYMGLGMVAWPYAERTPRLGHGSSSPPFRHTSNMGITCLGG